MTFNNQTFSTNLDLTKYKPAKLSSPMEIENQTNLFEKVDSVKYTKQANYEVNASVQVSVFDVAAYILKKIGSTSTMKLHKLLYYCQAWSLVWDDAPLFPERIEAWANGPVVKSFFFFHKGQFSISEVTIGNPDLLSIKQKETVDSVLGFYGDKTSQWLIDLTHLESPWKDARKNLDVSQRGNSEISHFSMAEYYSSL